MSYESNPHTAGDVGGPTSSPFVKSPPLSPSPATVSSSPGSASIGVTLQSGATRELVLSVMREVNAALNIELPNVELESVITDEFLAGAAEPSLGNSNSAVEGDGTTTATSTSSDLDAPTGGRRAREQAPKNDVSHPVLVCGACGHIIIAVAQAVAQTVNDAAHDSASPFSINSGFGNNTKSIAPQKKKRGGILGFKELAAKANLSPWHFHRVFRSVTDVTPKAYGEASWEHLMRRHGFEVENLAAAPATAFAKPPLSPESRISPDGSPASNSAAGQQYTADSAIDQFAVDSSSRSAGPGRSLGVGRVIKACSGSYTRNRSRSRSRLTGPGQQPIITAMSSFQRTRSLERPAIRERVGHDSSFEPQQTGPGSSGIAPQYMRCFGEGNVNFTDSHHFFNDTSQNYRHSVGNIGTSSQTPWDLPGSLPNQHFMPSLNTQFVDLQNSGEQQLSQQYSPVGSNVNNMSSQQHLLNYRNTVAAAGAQYPGAAGSASGSAAAPSKPSSAASTSAAAVIVGNPSGSGGPYGIPGVPPRHALPPTHESVSSEYLNDFSFDDLASHPPIAGSESTSATSNATSPYRLDEMDELFNFGTQAKSLAHDAALWPNDQLPHRTLSDRASAKPFDFHKRSKSHSASFQLMPPSPVLDMPDLNGLSLKRLEEHSVFGNNYALSLAGLDWPTSEIGVFNEEELDQSNGLLYSNASGALDALGDLPPLFYMNQEQKESYENEIVGDASGSVGSHILFPEGLEEPLGADLRQEPLPA